MNAITHGSAITLLSLVTGSAGWRGNDGRLAGAIPHDADRLTPEDFAQTLRNLGLPVVDLGGRMDEIAASDTPCLFAGADGVIRAILEVRGDGSLLACRDDEAATAWIAPRPLEGRLIHVGRAERARPTLDAESLAEIVRSFRGQIGLLAAASFFITLLGFSTPLLIMVVYDRLIPARAGNLLVSLIVGMAGILAADMALRLIRGRALAWIGSRIEHRMGLALFRKLAAMPLDRLEKSDVEQQIARLKQFEGLRDVFTGPILNTLLDLPFTLLFLAVLWALAPNVGLLIVGLAVLFVLMTWITLPIQLRLNERSGRDRSAHQSLMLEAATHQREIQRLGMEKTWQERHHALVRGAAETTRKARQFGLVVQTLGQSIMMFAGVGAVVLGTEAALGGQMTFGALIAVMALVWKVLAPIQSLQASAAQVTGYLRSARQVERVLTLPEEMSRGPVRSHTKQFRGRLDLNGVSHRYGERADASLSGVSLTIQPGEFVVVCGRNSSGKSTLLKLIDGLYDPTGGSLQIDGIDYRQIAVDDLRAAVAYSPQDAELFHGTIAQNFRLAAPLATDDEIWSAIDRVGLRDEIAHLPEGLETRLTEAQRRDMSRATLRALTLARGLLKDAPVLLFDNPCDGLDDAVAAAFLDHLLTLRGSRTIVMVSDRPSHMKLADRLVFLDRGRVVVNDTGEPALRKINALYRSMRKS